MYIEQSRTLTYVILLPKYIEFPEHLMVKIFLWNYNVTTHGENNFTVPIIKLRMFWGYISIIGASTEAKTRVISICTLFSDLWN